MYEKNGAEYSTRTECIDWRYSAAILGLVKFYEYVEEEDSNAAIFSFLDSEE